MSLFKKKQPEPVKRETVDLSHERIRQKQIDNVLAKSDGMQSNFAISPLTYNVYLTCRNIAVERLNFIYHSGLIDPDGDYYLADLVDEDLEFSTNGDGSLDITFVNQKQVALLSLVALSYDCKNFMVDSITVMNGDASLIKYRGKILEVYRPKKPADLLADYSHGYIKDTIGFDPVVAMQPDIHIKLIFVDRPDNGHILSRGDITLNGFVVFNRKEIDDVQEDR